MVRFLVCDGQIAAFPWRGVDDRRIRLAAGTQEMVG
jgi:hypothetical protein